MKFDISIQNLGKIDSANIKLRPFTVISGANSSGKSFVTKALYSFFSTINTDHVTRVVRSQLARLRLIAQGCRRELNNPSSIVLEDYKYLLEYLGDFQSFALEELGNCTYTEQISREFVMSEHLLVLSDHVSKILDSISGTKKYEDYKESIQMISFLLKQLKEIIETPTSTLVKHVEKGFKESLKENFQVASLTDIKRVSSKKNDKIKFDLGSLGYIEIDNEDIAFSLRNDSINDFQALYNVVFLESPIYWKLRRPLKKLKENQGFYGRFPNFDRNDEQLTGVPKYFYDLTGLLDEKYKSNEHNQSNVDLYHQINKTIGGELDISEDGDICFKENQHNININLTATGITNLGLIGLLLKRNVIAKGSYIFVDEPEVNLHPAWQKLMVETLYKLSLNGINVVIASHSIDMIKYIENIVETVPKDQLNEHFAINQLSSDGTSLNDDDDPLRKLASIKSDLGASFFDMVLDGDYGF